MVAMEAFLSALLAAVPELRAAGRLDGVVRLEGHGGNITYRLDMERGCFALKRPARPDPFVAIAEEIEATRIASELHIGAGFVFAGSDGTLLTRWVDNASVMSVEAFRRDTGAVLRLADTVSRLHRSGMRLARPFEPLRVLGDYRRRIGTDRTPPWSSRLEEMLQAVQVGLSRSPLPLVPSHCDLVPSNCLDDGTRMVLIDWEYARMNDPTWDLAYASAEAEFTTEQEFALLSAYGDPHVTAARLQVFKLVVLTINGLWSLLQEERVADGMASLARADALAADRHFGACLDGVGSYP